MNITYTDIVSIRSIEDIYQLLNDNNILYLGDVSTALCVFFVIIIFTILFSLFLATKVGKFLNKSEVVIDNDIVKIFTGYVNNKYNNTYTDKEYDNLTLENIINPENALVYIKKPGKTVLITYDKRLVQIYNDSTNRYDITDRCKSFEDVIDIMTAEGLHIFFKDILKTDAVPYSDNKEN